MATANVGDQINDLIEKEQWARARALIEKELVKDPDSHWLLTQLGETYYEEKQYKKALEILLKSRNVVPDCPLTMWHLAGTLDALGYHIGALELYLWILESTKTAEDDSCWESAEWTDSLKTDCVYRVGLCFRHMNKIDKATDCLLQYVRLLSIGMSGSYPIDEALGQITILHESTKQSRETELKRATRKLRKESGTERSKRTPVLNEKKLQHLQQA